MTRQQIACDGCGTVVAGNWGALALLRLALSGGWFCSPKDDYCARCVMNRRSAAAHAAAHARALFPVLLLLWVAGCQVYRQPAPQAMTTMAVAALTAGNPAEPIVMTSDFYTLGTCQSHRCVRDDAERVCQPSDFVCAHYPEGSACEFLFCSLENLDDTPVRVWLGVAGEDGAGQQMRLVTLPVMDVTIPGSDARGTTGVGFYSSERIQCIAEATDANARFRLNGWPIEVMP